MKPSGFLQHAGQGGICFAIATARYWIGAERYIHLLNPDYEITTDGTLIHSGGKCIYSCEFSVSHTNMIIQNIIRAVPEAEVTAACGKTVYWNSRHIAKSEKLHKAVYWDYSSPLDMQANKIVAELPDEMITREIASKMNCKLQCYRGKNGMPSSRKAPARQPQSEHYQKQAGSVWMILWLSVMT